MPAERIEHIDGPCLARIISSGAQWVASKRLHLNEINVFPVPDGDTGTNLTMTLKAAADAVRGVSDRPLGEVAAAMSRAVIYGARGNAGIILAQFLRGFAREVQGVVRLYPKPFAAAIAAALDDTYAALAQPTEGTILTVISSSVGAAARMVRKGESDFARILDGMLDASREALAMTPELLPVLKEAGVVDAGGEGFVDLLEGVRRMVRGEEVGDVLGSIPFGTAPVPRLKERDLKYRYCTEFIVEGPEADVGELKIRLAGMGGSVVVVGSPGLVRCHIHTNSPDVAFDVAATFGTVRGRKVDDMREQHREFVYGVAGGVRTGAAARAAAGSALGTDAVPPARDTLTSAGEVLSPDASKPPPATVGWAPTGRRGAASDRRRRRVRIVTDSTADLPPSVAADLGITVVPLTVNFTDGSFRCGVDITDEQFYARLERSDELPTTSQPTPEDFARVYEELSWETRGILSVHVSSAMSGTCASALTARDTVKGVEVAVVDSRLASAPLGMTVVEAAKAADDGAHLEDLRKLVEDMSGRARVFFTVGTLEYLLKGGRIGRARALLGKLAGIRPVLTIDDGTVAPAGRARGEEALLAMLLELAGPELRDGASGALGVVHARRPEMAERAASAFSERFGFQEVHVFQLGGVVGTHAGPGTWGVSYFRR